MSFVIYVEADELTWEGAREIAGGCCVSTGLETYAPGKPLLPRFSRNRRPSIWIESRYGGNDLFADDAHWDAQTWSMRPDLLPRLGRTLECLSEHLPDGFTFFAGWAGEDERARRVTYEQLAALAAQGRLATHTRYIVRG